MTILIADDERLARYSLKSMLKESGIPPSSIQIACDGQEMVEKVARLRPNLAFVDIKMPRLNGLEAIQKGRTLSPHTKWIILTSYSMFDYAQQAVSLGASAYLLKPVSPQELVETIHRITQVNRGTYQRLNDEFEAHLTSLLHSTTSVKDEAHQFLDDAVFWGSLLVFDSNLSKNELLLQEHRVCDLIRTKQSAVVDQNTRIALCRLADGQLALIGAWTPGHGERESREAIRDLFRKLQISLNSEMPRSVCCTIIVGEHFDNYKELCDHLYSLSELAPLRAIIGVGASIPWSLIRDRREIQPEIELCRCLADLSTSVQRGTYLDFLKFVDAVAGTWRNIPENRRMGTYNQILRFLRVTLDFRSASQHRGDSWQAELRQHGKQLFENPAGRRPKEIIDQVVAFMDSNYMHDIGVAQIANDLGLTPNYLSQRFHKKTGTTFVKHLTGLRMTKARELLADPSQQIQQVAHKVGYSSSRHFSAQFKLHEGLTPSEYRKDRGRRFGSPRQ